MYDPYDWYWRADDGRVFSSARQAIVDADDEEYLGWRNDARQPTPWPLDDAGQQTDAALQAVLTPFGLYVGLAEAKAGHKAAVDQAAERERKKYITPGEGQAMEYQQAATEAIAYLAALEADPKYEPEPGAYPMLEASIGIDGDTLAEVATTVAAMHTQWQMIGSAIRTVRLAAKAAVGAAESVEAAQAVLDGIKWPTPQEVAR
ncbi:hypothetical protein [Phyllobacterium leguminum]|uniref:DUF4376 domain-containing protein n=1 Tax=Phyllobacterium leguminum TaxID=314237 RepID=A0A318T3F2_9HYPH|nr:hypothetical protein [Phyllobacterium leguminum]PYE87390.1 hypothetical protein C7477_11311 [Phyllobacterium leguminum]